MKIFTVVGARPNFLKIDKDLTQTIVHTGQHYDDEMSAVFFKELKLPRPKYNLNCVRFGKMFDKLSLLLSRQRPDMVIVFGDTDSSLAGALAAFKNYIQIAHVEAGLRSGIRMPEEMNRILIDKVATIRLCPNEKALANLRKEGIKENAYVVGDSLTDTFGQFLPLPKGKNYKKFMLLTLHRNFNADDKKTLKSVLTAVKKSSEPFIFPIHPRTAKNIKKFKLTIPNNLKLIKPVSYIKMLDLISNAKKVLTDSGGVQREAYWMNVPVIILRNETEWPEIIESGAGILVGTQIESIGDAIRNFKGRIVAVPSFGAKKRIREIIYRYL